MSNDDFFYEEDELATARSGGMGGYDFEKLDFLPNRSWIGKARSDGKYNVYRFFHDINGVIDDDGKPRLIGALMNWRPGTAVELFHGLSHVDARATIPYQLKMIPVKPERKFGRDPFLDMVRPGEYDKDKNTSSGVGVLASQFYYSTCVVTTVTEDTMVESDPVVSILPLKPYMVTALLEFKEYSDTEDLSGVPLKLFKVGKGTATRMKVVPVKGLAPVGMGSYDEPDVAQWAQDVRKCMDEFLVAAGAPIANFPVKGAHTSEGADPVTVIKEAPAEAPAKTAKAKPVKTKAPSTTFDVATLTYEDLLEMDNDTLRAFATDQGVAVPSNARRGTLLRAARPLLQEEETADL